MNIFAFDPAFVQFCNDVDTFSLLKDLEVNEQKVVKLQVRTFSPSCMYGLNKTQTETQTQKQAQTDTHTYTYAHRDTYTHTHVHLYTHAYTHTHTHTHARTRTRTSTRTFGCIYGQRALLLLLLVLLVSAPLGR